MNAGTYYTITSSPVGDILLTATERGLSGLYLATPTRPHQIPAAATADATKFREVLTQLSEYFNGQRTSFTVDFDLHGSDFQKRVWRELCQIPFGAVISYKQLATQIGQPAACRAVGTANGKNPVSIIIPCHRVIAADGTLGGYGWGLAYKQQLLALEKKCSAT